MAYRRSLTTRAKLFAQQRILPTFPYINHGDNLKNHEEDPKSNNFLQNRSFGCYINTSLGFGGAQFRDRGCSQFIHPMTSGLLLARNMSTTVGDGAEKIEYIADVAEVLADKTVEAVTSQAPAVSEVAIAAADSWLPVAALQYFIDGIHNLTGFNWWASIVVTTLVIRGVTVPIMINQLKATTKLTLMRPQLDAIKQEMQERGMSPSAVADGQERMQKIFKEHGVSAFTPLKGLLIQGPVFVSFFLAIQNMVEKVPSFKDGGAFWFTDLTTPDSLYIFPVLTALTFWITVELNMQEGLEGNPAAKTMKNVSRVFAALSIPLTMNFPKALFCYWITSNLFSLVYGAVIKKHSVKKFLNIPIIVAPPPGSSAQKPAFSFFDAVKKYAKAQAQKSVKSVTAETKPANQSIPSSPLITHKSSPTEAMKPANHRVSSSSVLSHRIKSLEKEVKARKKGKKR